MSVINNSEVARLIKTDYQLSDIQNLISFLQERDTFAFPTLDNGLFPAAVVSNSTEYTGYAAVWVRDNVYVAYCHYLSGKTNIAVNNVRCLMQYIKKHRFRWLNIIDGKVDLAEVMQRPHVRFNGKDLSEIEQDWQQAQNDAWGYFLWFYCKLINDKAIEPTPEDLAILALFPEYFKAIAYWQDEDSGHWEEDRKISASSIGVVIASLQSFRQLLIYYTESARDRYQIPIAIELLDSLIQKGSKALAKILPAECIQPEHPRRYDAALLFLIYPLEILDSNTSDRIIADVTENLQGKYGISRYLHDSFWCRDYQQIPENIRTSISTEREQWLQERGRSLKLGEEAQWCIFDPILSAIYGVRFHHTHQSEFLTKQIYYLNRSLGQLTATDSKFGGFKCPELYYLKQDKYVPNDATPLLWTQANLLMALKIMEQSLSK
ncbi:glycoside hydrolase family 15 protein [Myxosarcina sp. GI1]|uniref:glycoside hydrolase family 15 protein n=1 Tax=Myxosarcina sp. GI1 TaxID=1541065 RepID=UPI0005651C15|nr:glycoside hydrolase family 15 protein [Myxosarcina sp. GI1]